MYLKFWDGLAEQKLTINLSSFEYDIHVFSF